MRLWGFRSEKHASGPGSRATLLQDSRCTTYFELEAALQVAQAPMTSSGRALDMISPRIKNVSAGMVARDRKERTITINRTPPVLAMERAWEEVYGLSRTDIEALQRVYNQLKNSHGLVGPEDLEKRFIRLDYEFAPATDFGISEVEDIIWEVDEDADGYIDWHNFVQLYGRARSDPKNKEPRRLFNLIDFMICDKDGGGNIDEDECLDILYKRYGKEAMEQLSETLLNMFGRDIDYNEFLQLVGNNIDGGGRIPSLLAAAGLHVQPHGV